MSRGKRSSKTKRAMENAKYEERRAILRLLRSHAGILERIHAGTTPKPYDKWHTATVLQALINQIDCGQHR